jgi:hypothetical protein
VTGAQAALAASRTAALGLTGYDVAVQDAEALVQTELEGALDAVAASARKVRGDIAARVARVRGVLEQATADEAGVAVRLYGLQSVNGTSLLALRDVGEPAAWPSCARDLRGHADHRASLSLPPSRFMALISRARAAVAGKA